MSAPTKSLAWQQRLQTARINAQQGAFDDCLSTCQQIVSAYKDNPDALLSVGALLSSFGFITAARDCFLHVSSLVPNDVRPVVNMANLAREAGEHARSRNLYTLLLERLPDHPVIRRNALVSLEYDPDVSDTERFSQAKAWGDWAVVKTGGQRKQA